MNKGLALQQNKVFSSYGGVCSMIDTIEDLSMMVLPFDEWGHLYSNVCTGRRNDLLIDEPRLLSRIRSLGFKKLDGFFHPDTSLDEEPNFKPYSPNVNEKARMIATQYFPRWFFCPKCHHFMSFDEWKDEWDKKFTTDGKFDNYAPACCHCAEKRVNSRPKVRQTRFVMASMETGEICDIPWRKIFNKQGSTDSKKGHQVWEFDENSPECKTVKLLTSSASTTLARIFIENEHGKRVSMAEIFSHYIVMREGGKTVGVFKPVVSSDNNVYYAYNLNCIYIPQYLPKQEDVDTIKRFCDNNISDPTLIKTLAQGQLSCSIEDIKKIIDNGFKIEIPTYDSEEKFRIEEFDFITNPNNYVRGIFEDPDRRLISHEYCFAGQKPKFIKDIYYQTRLNVTTAQIAYSRIDKISMQCLPFWGGKNAEKPKLWYDRNIDDLRDVEVQLHPTCSGKIENIEKMPAFSSFGEGFLVEMNVDYIPEGKRHEFMHTFCHLLMKEMEFVCGYPISSMNERIYCIPSDKKYGFLIYSVGGASGSYGGISSLFTSGNIEQIIEDVMLLAEDCSNDPICKAEGGSCFGCVQIPETTCEEFNNSLSRNTFNAYK